MPRLIKRKALQICYELWIWLYHHPSKNKEDWPGWKKYGRMSNDCPCCEYCSFYCRECPLLKFWQQFQRGFHAPCDNWSNKTATTPYSKWTRAKSSKTRKKYALIIANGTKAELVKLPPLKKKRADK